MNEIIDLLCYVFIGYWAGRLLSTLLAPHLGPSAEEVRELEARLKSIIHAVKIEKHNGVEYWYDLDSEQFLAQGTTRTELVEALKKRFDGHVFLINEEAEKGILTGPDFNLVRTVNTQHLKDLLK